MGGVPQETTHFSKQLQRPGTTFCIVAEVQQRPWKQHIDFFYKKRFFIKIPDLVYRPTAAPVAAVNCR